MVILPFVIAWDREVFIFNVVVENKIRGTEGERESRANFRGEQVKEREKVKLIIITAPKKSQSPIN